MTKQINQKILPKVKVKKGERNNENNNNERKVGDECRIVS